MRDKAGTEWQSDQEEAWLDKLAMTVEAKTRPNKRMHLKWMLLRWLTEDKTEAKVGHLFFNIDEKGANVKDIPLFERKAIANKKSSQHPDNKESIQQARDKFSKQPTLELKQDNTLDFIEATGTEEEKLATRLAREFNAQVEGDIRTLYTPQAEALRKWLMGTVRVAQPAIQSILAMATNRQQRDKSNTNDQ